MRVQDERKGVSDRLENRRQKTARAPMRLISVLLFIAAAFVILFSVQIYLKYHLSASDYVRAEASGVDGFGSLSLSIDAEALISDIEKARTLSEGDKEEIISLAKKEEKSLEASKTEGLSNGESVRISADFGKRLKTYGMFRHGETVFQVKGLKARTELFLNDYVSVSFKGFNGHGEADESFDREALGKDVISEMVSLSSEKEAKAFEKEKLEKLLDSVRISMAAPSELQNGDTVYVSMTMENPVLKESGIVFTWEDYSMKAKGLTEVYRMKPADYLTCSFTGYDGSGRTELSFDSEKLRADLEERFRTAGGAYDQMAGALADTAESGGKTRVVELIQKSGDLYAQEAAVAELEVENAVSRSFTTSVSQRDHLYNGNPVTVSVKAASSLYLPHFGILLQNGERTFQTAKLRSFQYIYLNDFIAPEFSGYEGYGTAEAVIDIEALEGRAAQALSETMPEEEAWRIVQESFQEQYISAIDASLSKHEGLSEGETVTLSISMDELEIPGTGIRFAFQNQKVKVEGLEKVLNLRIADYFSAAASGFEGAGELELGLDLEALEEELVRAGREKSLRARAGMSLSEAAEMIEEAWESGFTTRVSGDSLRNGDAVTVSSVSSGEVYLPEIGVRLLGGRRMFTVEGLAAPQPVDLTEAVEVSFIGIAPNLYARFELDDSLPYIADTSLADLEGEWIHASYGEDYQLSISYDADALLRKGIRVTEAKRTIRIRPLNDLVIDSTPGLDLSKISKDGSLTDAALPEREMPENSQIGWKHLALAAMALIFLFMSFFGHRNLKNERHRTPAIQIS